MYFEKGDFTRALDYNNRALKAYGNSENSPNAYNAIGRVYLRQKKYEAALQNHKTALSISEKTGAQLNVVQSLMGQANVYVEQADYRSGISIYKRAEKVANELGIINLKNELYRDMAISYSQLSDYANAFRYQTLYTDVKDSIYNLETDKKLTTIQFDFDLQKKQWEINLLTADKA